MVERQKTNATTSADQPDAAAPNDLDAVDTMDAVDGEDLYYQQESNSSLTASVRSLHRGA